MPSLSAFFLFLAVVGGAVALMQALASLLGVGHDDIPDDHAFHAEHASGSVDAATALGVFNFRSIRAIAAGISFTGLGGLLALRSFNGVVATALALLLGTAIYLFVAFIMRGFQRLQADNTVHPLRAVGLEALVSLPIPAQGGGPGKVTLVVAGRRVEWPAVQASGEPIPSGRTVQVVDAADDTTLTVVSQSHLS